MPTNAPKAGKPSKEIFDPFNSSATGHQRAENRLSGSTLWRDSRHRKLREQFSSDAGAGKRVSDTVGAGAVGELKMGLEESGRITWYRPNDQASLQETLKIAKDVERPAKRMKLNEAMSTSTGFVDSTTPLKKKDHAERQKADIPPSPSDFLSPIDPNTSFGLTASPPEESETREPSEENEEPVVEDPPPRTPQIFARTTIYINGSTAPLISDHKLKQLLMQHGANISISLGRRTVTHVILGRPNSASNSNGSGRGRGAGGGLSGSKIQKEIVRKRGESVKYVTAEWVVESVKAGKRLPERRFEAVRLAPMGVRSGASFFGGRQKAEGELAKEGEG